MTAKQNIYNIPPSLPFADHLAAGLIKQVEGNPEQLARYLILLPTRRACRNLQEAFLRQSDGKPIMLPRMQPFGDIDTEELSLSGYGADELEIPPAISSLKRQILLSYTISKLPDFSRDPVQDMALAKALGALMDQIYTENLDLSALPTLVDAAEISEHWQITVRFLEILSDIWPKILAENNVIDAADRRNRLMQRLNQHWQKNPPQTPVIAAGSTGSIPATAEILKTILTLPQGTIILPGLDTHLDEKTWDAVEEGHPQATLKQLLKHLELKPTDVKNWPNLQTPNNQIYREKEKFISHALTPSEKTDIWQKLSLSSEQKESLETSLKNITRYDCDTSQDEAGLISLIMRETLEEPSKTTALITSDRQLARRVSAYCHRWGIKINDSAGKSLSDSALGLYLRLSAKAMIDGIRPSSFLALLKHDYCHGNKFEGFRSTVRLMEYDLMHGLPVKGFDQIKERFETLNQAEHKKKKPHQKSLDLVHHLENTLCEFQDKFTNGYHDFLTLLKSHLKIAEALANKKDVSGEQIWIGEAGEAALKFFADLQEQAPWMPQVNGTTYLDILSDMMRGITTRPKYGTHPRLMILGQLEARLIQTDRVILAGLNEGSWPPNPGHDPWMSRPMRQKFGLPIPERAITLAAHDFMQGFCNKEVILTRAKRVDGTPTVPARWLQRIDTLIQALKLDENILYNGHHDQLLKSLNNVWQTKPVERPMPRPPVSTRPRKLSVTKIEKWLKDPYAIYAEKILKLRPLEPLEKEPGASEKGTILHEIMERFTAEYPKDLPKDAVQNFIVISKDVLEKEQTHNDTSSFWISRLISLADWLIPHEQKWRKSAEFSTSEAEGSIEINTNTAPFTLTARADRMDKTSPHEMAIIDYKSGGTYSSRKIKTGELPQLPLEALILQENGFKNIQNKKVGYLGYWTLTGGDKGGSVRMIDKEQDIDQAISNAKTGLGNLINCFDQEETPYIAIPKLDSPPRFNDYEYLERVKEWTALGDSNEEAA